MITPDDEKWMRHAIDLAAAIDPKATDPNPRVGGVIIQEGLLLSEGVHAYDGGPHAERVALEKLNVAEVNEATLYVTLEPCSTQGRTGACCDRIIAVPGVKRVVIGAIDPNPHHRGRGVAVLENAGVEVELACLEEACTSLNPEFNRRMEKL